MNYEERLALAKARLEACIKAKQQKEATKKEVIKTSETPDVMTPIERAKALQRKSAEKFDNHIASLYLPSLNKEK